MPSGPCKSCLQYWLGQENVCHLGFMPFGPRRGCLCNWLVWPVGVRQDSKTSSSFVHAVMKDRRALYYVE